MYRDAVGFFQHSCHIPPPKDYAGDLKALTPCKPTQQLSTEICLVQPHHPGETLLSHCGSHLPPVCVAWDLICSYLPITAWVQKVKWVPKCFIMIICLLTVCMSFFYCLANEVGILLAPGHSEVDHGQLVCSLLT